MAQDKACIYCECILPPEAFHVRKDTGRRVGACKECRASRSKRYYAENTQKHHATVKRRYDTFGRFKRYGITVEQYDEALQKQGGRCALCGVGKPGGKGKWHIDHCHASKCFRGVLCHNCNVSLGHYEKLSARIGHEKLLAYVAAGGGINVPQDVQPNPATPIRRSSRARA